jgi:hypothetical protein
MAGVMMVLVAGCAHMPEPAPGHEKPVYEIKRATVTPELAGKWDGEAWRSANDLRVDHFYPLAEKPSPDAHRPLTRARVLYDDKGIYVHFLVNDRYVRCIETKYHGKVWEDACAEFFVQPKADRGYFNFEINCAGTMLLSYHENPAYKGPVTREGESVPEDLASQVKIFHSVPGPVDPENPNPLTWQIEYFIPYTLFETYVGPIGNVKGQTWQANFYKCAENNSHPHWASWSTIWGKLDFHQPEYFGLIRFE